jgi:hypothetical protein
MSTRAMFTFADDEGEFHVYMHCDGYPKGAAVALLDTFGHAWPTPRFEANEFVVAFVVANKTQPGHIRLMNGATWQDAAPMDIQFRYLITRAKSGTILVTGFSVGYDDDSSQWREHKLFCTRIKTLGELSEKELDQ